MDSAKVRAWWYAKQGLDRRATVSAGDALARHGWARSVGGVNPYLSIFARTGLRRAEIERAVADGEIQELPAARGCTYFVPASDYALALRMGRLHSDSGDLATAKRYLGYTDAELDRLSEAIVAALAAGPLDPKAIKDTVGDAVRQFGPEGKRRGVTTSLGLGLGRLQSTGRIRRIPVDGRLDTQRYRYALWEPNPLSDPEGESPATSLARHYWHWIGPASLAQFQGFSGLGVKAAQEATAPLGLTALEPGGDLLVTPEDRAAFRSWSAPGAPSYALVSALDSMILLRRDAPSLVHAEDRARKVAGEKGMFELGHLVDLTCNAILDRGRVVGLWEFDPFDGRIVWNAFVAPGDEMREVIAQTEAFIREDLGDARTFSLDSPESRRPKLEALRAGLAR